MFFNVFVGGFHVAAVHCSLTCQVGRFPRLRVGFISHIQLVKSPEKRFRKAAPLRTTLKVVEFVDFLFTFS